MSVRSDEAGQRRIHYQLEEGDMPTSGSESTRHHTTFYTKHDTSFTVRSVGGDDAFELSGVLLCVSALSAGLTGVLMSGIPASKNVFFAFVFLGILFVLAVRGLREEERVGKEVLFVLATGITLILGDQGIPILLALLLGLLFLFRYVPLWRGRALWEPMVGVGVFSVGILLYVYGVLPSWLLRLLFIGLTVFGLVSFLRIQVDAARYDRGFGSLTEY